MYRSIKLTLFENYPKNDKAENGKQSAEYCKQTAVHCKQTVEYCKQTKVNK